MNSNIDSGRSALCRPESAIECAEAAGEEAKPTSRTGGAANGADIDGSALWPSMSLIGKAAAGGTGHGPAAAGGSGDSPPMVYVHIPFCKSKCAYCDFVSFAGCEGKMAAYVGRLCAELSQRAHALAGREVGSVYIGGGTPSTLPPGLFARICAAVREHFSLSRDVEWSCECNPGTLTDEWLDAAAEGGVNRLSMGVQTMHPQLLAEIGRIHTPEQVLESIERCRQHGFARLNADIMYGLPGQTAEMLSDTLSAVCETGISHISCYSLILEEGTPLHRRVSAGEATLPEEDEVLAMQRLATRFLEAKGLFRYEISNYAMPGQECRHNVGYWQRRPYLGLGLAAHSLLGGQRLANTEDMDAYLQGAGTAFCEEVDSRGAVEESILLGTRMCAGIDIPAWEGEFALSFEKTFGKQAQALAELGLMAYSADGGRIFCTEKGLELHSQCVYRLLAEL